MAPEVPENNRIVRVHKNLQKDPFDEDFTVYVSKHELKDPNGSSKQL